MFMITIIYNYILYMPKEYLQKKMEAHQVYVGCIRIWKRKESYLLTVWNNLNHAGHIPSLKI